MKPIYEYISVLKKNSFRIVLTTHHRPDADAMGSSLALYSILRKLGHEVVVVVPNRPAQYLRWMPHMEHILVYDEDALLAKAAIESCDWIFALDYNAFHRTKTMEAVLTNARQPKVLIDHHQLPDTKSFEYGISDTRKSSTSEMVFDFIEDMGLSDGVDINAMELIYAGIIGDTGSFAFSSTTVNAFKIAATFKQKGLSTHRVYERLFQSESINKIKFSGYAITNLMQVFEKQQTAIIAIPLDVYQSYHLEPGDLEGLVNIPLSIQNIRFSAMALAISPNQTKWSFRSLGTVDVNAFARNYFNGGGHINAAGGTSEKGIDMAIKDFQQALQKMRIV